MAQKKDGDTLLKTTKKKVVKVRMLKSTEKCKIGDEVYMNEAETKEEIEAGIIEIIKEEPKKRNLMINSLIQIGMMKNIQIRIWSMRLVNYLEKNKRTQKLNIIRNWIRHSRNGQVF